MRQSMLTDEQAQFLREEKEALSEIKLALAGIDAPRETLTTLQDAILQLDELFLMVVVGEFNAGKSALVNALLGEKVLLEGATPTTSRVTLVKWGEKIGEQIVDENFAIYTHPLPLLKELNIVDTPGTNAVIRYHERLTEEFVPRSDLVLFTTSADHPLTESERQFLERIMAWGKKVVIALNKADIIEDEAALDEIRSFVLKHVTSVLGDIPEFFPASARTGQKALAEPDEQKRNELWAKSGLQALEQYITSTLDDTTRLQLKFNNPLGVADNIVTQLTKETQSQAESLKEDLQTATSLESTVTEYARDLQNELTPRLAEVENILHRLEQRGLDFFDTTMRLTNIQNLIRGDKVRADFEKRVLADVPKQIEEQVQRMIDWLVQKDLQEWQRVMTYVQRRQALHSEHIVGEGLEPRELRRKDLIDKMGKKVQGIVGSYDRDKEASELAKQVETAVAQTAALEAGALGLGTLVTAAIVSSSMDITGILAAGTLAIVGFFVIPYKRNQAKEDFKKKMTSLRTRLLETLTTSFTTETKNAVERLNNGIAPYTRFVRIERERIEKSETVLSELRKKLSVLRARSQAVTGSEMKKNLGE